jgi:hypothetical protein
MRRIAKNPEVVVVQNPAVSFSPLKGIGHMRRHKSRRRRNNPKHRKHAYKGIRRHVRNNKGRKGKYSAFVKKHKGLFKKMGFKAASRKIASMWKH